MPFTLEFPYNRSVGPVIGGFLGGLRDGVVRGVKTAGGRVLVPPLEYDPETGEATTDMVDVASSGVITGFTWNDAPREAEPLDRPFAWALIQLDGADTSLLHVVDVASAGDLAVGQRVRARWRAERRAHITDIECFEPEAAT